MSTNNCGSLQVVTDCTEEGMGITVNNLNDAEEKEFTISIPSNAELIEETDEGGHKRKRFRLPAVS